MVRICDLASHRPLRFRLCNLLCKGWAQSLKGSHWSLTGCAFLLHLLFSSFLIWQHSNLPRKVSGMN